MKKITLIIFIFVLSYSPVIVAQEKLPVKYPIRKDVTIIDADGVFFFSPAKYPIRKDVTIKVPVTSTFIDILYEAEKALGYKKKYIKGLREIRKNIMLHWDTSKFLDADTIISISTLDMMPGGCGIGIISPEFCEAIISLNDTVFYTYEYYAKKFSLFEYNAEVAYAIRKLKKHQLEKYYIPINNETRDIDDNPTTILIIRQKGGGRYHVEERSSRWDPGDFFWEDAIEKFKF